MESFDGWLDWTSVEAVQGSLAHGMEDFLLPAEEIIAEGRGVVLVNIDVAGTLLVTNFRLIFVSEGQRNVVPLGTIPLSTIEKFHKHPMRASSASRVRDKTVPRRLLQVTGKDMRIVSYAFRARTKQRRAVFEGLMRLMKPARIWDLYAFASGPLLYSNSDPRARLRAEYLRLLGCPLFGKHYDGEIVAGQVKSGHYWRLTEVNSSYNLCSTYPSLFITASSISDEEVQQAAAFRARGRLPVVSWRHPSNGAVLARSSQPLIGIMMNNRSNADEKLVAALCTSNKNSQERRKLYIADARPRKNALANGAMGGGSESPSNYAQSEVVFLGIDNIHAMRDSLSRLRDYLDMHGAASSDGSSSILRSGGLAWGGGNLSSMAAAVSALGDSGWLMHIHSVLAGAAWIAARITLEGASVLVHCSDGWDRTTQLISLAEIMVDPYYRTFKGFQALVEKDWLAFGHPFADRLGMPTYIVSCTASTEALRQTRNSGSSLPPNVAGSSSFTSSVSTHSPGAASNNYSPIFLQWIDCVAQLLRLYPRAFEFSSAFLVEMLDCVLSCQFRNFLCNSEKERLQAGITDECCCMWIYLEKQRSSRGKEHEHYNIFFSHDQHDYPLLPPAAALAPTLWPHFFLRWACPSDIGSDGRLPSSRVQSAELENQCRVLVQSFSGLTEVKNTAEIQIKELTEKVKVLNEQLLIERRAAISAATIARKGRKESAAMKQAMQAIGCTFQFSDRDNTLSESGLDEDEFRKESVAADAGGIAGGHRHAERPEELSVYLSAASNVDMPANLFRKTCGNASCSLRNGEGCNWPHSNCACMNSAFVGLRVNFDALEHLSIVESYFNPDRESSQELYVDNSDPHRTGIT